MVSGLGLALPSDRDLLEVWPIIEWQQIVIWSFILLLFLSLVLGYLSEEQQQEMCNAPNGIELNWEFGKCIVLDNKQSLRRSSFVDFAA